MPDEHRIGVAAGQASAAADAVTGFSVLRAVCSAILGCGFVGSRFATASEVTHCCCTHSVSWSNKIAEETFVE
jgi:hypothetical protein